MKWPYERRVDAAHAWGVVAVGTTGIVAISTVLATLHSTDDSFRWWWPTNWMIAPMAIFLVGLGLAMVPVIGSRHSKQADVYAMEAGKMDDGSLTGDDDRGGVARSQAHDANTKRKKSEGSNRNDQLVEMARHPAPMLQPPELGNRISQVSSAAQVPAGHAFISYVREDSGKVDALQRELEAAGVPVWRDTANLWPGENWRTKIRDAITEDALVFIACFSSSSGARYKSYHNEEIRLAIDQLQMRRPDDPWLIPVRFDDCNVPEFELGAGRTLASIQRADLFGVNGDLETGRVVAIAQRLLQRPNSNSAIYAPASLAEGGEPPHKNPPESAIVPSRENHGEENAQQLSINALNISGSSLSSRSPLVHGINSSDAMSRSMPASRSASKTESESHSWMLRPGLRRTVVLAASVAIILTIAGTVAALARPGNRSPTRFGASPSAIAKAASSPTAPANATGTPPKNGITNAIYTGTTATQSGKVVAYAFAQLGCNYHPDGVGPCDVGFDAPGLLKSAWASAGISIPGDVHRQWATLPHVSSPNIQPGDLLFYRNTGLVAMYVGSGMIIVAFPDGDPVRELSMDTSWYQKNYNGAVEPPASSSIAVKSRSQSVKSSEKIGKALLSLSGDNETTQWACLYKLWMRVSGWNVYAGSSAGAYGIPAAKRANKMATDGRVWLTNPATQIAWGLGYISHYYGTPCRAWDHEVAHGYY